MGALMEKDISKLINDAIETFPFDKAAEIFELLGFTYGCEFVPDANYLKETVRELCDNVQKYDTGYSATGRFSVQYASEDDALLIRFFPLEVIAFRTGVVGCNEK
jgi:hypothetical protein